MIGKPGDARSIKCDHVTVVDPEKHTLVLKGDNNTGVPLRGTEPGNCPVCLWTEM